MKLIDPIYGECEVIEPLLTDLIASGPMQRLKKIAHFGLPDQYSFYQFGRGFTRYDHSIGVMLLLRRLGCGIEEQAAGLLHDVSHTAFSHIIDWLLGDPSTESYQDDHHLEVMNQSALKEIAARHGLTVERLADYHHYPILEREAPDLCADRVDYTLREIDWLGRHDEVQDCLAEATTFEDKLIFKSQKGAQLFGEMYVDRQRNNWGGPNARLRYKMFAAALRVALDEKIITVDDFSLDDETVMDKIRVAASPQVNALLEPMTIAFTEEYMEQAGAYDLQKKIRYVDPEFIQDGQLVRLSSVDPNYRADLALVKAGQ